LRKRVGIVGKATGVTRVIVPTLDRYAAASEFREKTQEMIQDAIN
jgi:hypothetical protein